MNVHADYTSCDSPLTLRIYLLGTVEFDVALSLQRRLVYEVSGDRSQGALVLCQHLPLITVGRLGSYNHILGAPEELRSRRWRVAWVNRGGGVLLHQLGQLAVYPILPLDRLRLTPADYLNRVHQVLLTLLADFNIPGMPTADLCGLCVRGRPIASVGCATRNWVTYYGAALNINPALEPFRLVRCAPGSEPGMTSLERERHGPVSPSLVRQRLIEHFTTAFGLAETLLFTDHPLLTTSTLLAPCGRGVRGEE